VVIRELPQKTGNNFGLPIDEGAQGQSIARLRQVEAPKGPKNLTAIEVQGNPISTEISGTSGWAADAGGVENPQLKRLALSGGDVDRGAAISKAEAAQLFDYAHLSMGMLSGQLKPGLFTKVTVHSELQKAQEAEVSRSGRYYLPVSLGMNRPITVSFEGPQGTLTIDTHSSNVRPGAATGFDGIPIKTSFGEVKRSEDLKGALAFKSEPAHYRWKAAAPAPISAAQAAEQLRFANLNMGGVHGEAKPGLFDRVTIAKAGMAPISADVDASGRFSLQANLGMNQPITLTFEGKQGTLQINAKSSAVGPGAATGFAGIPIRTSFGEIKRSETLKGALAFPSEPAEFLAGPTRPFA
jgi:hypothetical protein